MARVVFRYCLLIELIGSVLLTGCGAESILGRSRILVQWTTGSEFNTAGFNLYRSETSAGVYVKINSRLIPAAPDPVAGGRYEFEDLAVAPGKTYYYELEEVEYSGVATRHGPIIATASASWDWQVGFVVLGLGVAGLLLFRWRSKSRLA